MDNKKLLKYLLKDLSALDEMVAEKGSNSFDELEMEFLHTRVKGAKKLIQILHDRESNSILEKIEGQKVEVAQKLDVQESVISEPEINAVSEVVEEEIIAQKEIVKEPIKEIAEAVSKVVIQPNGEIGESKEELESKIEIVPNVNKEKEVELEEEEQVGNENHRLGDSFSKEKSVNDLMATENRNLEQKLSNRPLSNIQTAIGINDRFQFIRELFDGNAESFSNAVSDLDKMGDIKEAVEYLQQNYKWKKNETSLTFVNLVKRRFSNE